MMSPKERERVFGYVKILEAYLDGKEIQYNDGGGWITLSIQPHFNFASDGEYRVKPEPREFYLSFDGIGNHSWLIKKGSISLGTKILVREVLDNE